MIFSSLFCLFPFFFLCFVSLLSALFFSCPSLRSSEFLFLYISPLFFSGFLLSTLFHLPFTRFLFFLFFLSPSNLISLFVLLHLPFSRSFVFLFLLSPTFSTFRSSSCAFRPLCPCFPSSPLYSVSLPSLPRLSFFKILLLFFLHLSSTQ